MVIFELKLKNFRNYNNITIHFDSGINFITGKNGQGKTNLLESIYYLTHLRSFRTSKIQDLISFYQSESYIHCSFKKQEVSHEEKIVLFPNGKQVFMDRKGVRLSSELIQNYYSLLFAPDQVALFKTTPKIRRQYFDRILFLLSKNYFLQFQEFSKIQKNKNKLLKSKKKEEIKIWNQMLAQKIPFIVNLREKFVNEINENLTDCFYQITGNKKKVYLFYQHDFSSTKTIHSEYVESILEKKIDQEITTSQMQVGPQRDQYLLKIQEIQKESFFSQGEYRATLLALQFVIIDLIEKKLNFKPVLLLDDVFSELDSNISELLIEYILQTKNQCFVTATEIPEKFKNKGNYILIQDQKCVLL